MVRHRETHAELRRMVADTVPSHRGLWLGQPRPWGLMAQNPNIPGPTPNQPERCEWGYLLHNSSLLWVDRTAELVDGTGKVWNTSLDFGDADTDLVIR